jgi:hypothetical protein
MSLILKAFAPDGIFDMNNPMALHRDFSAVVDGTNGDTYLNSVTARFLHTTLAVSGKVVDINPEVKGRTIVLDALSRDARVEDLVRLAVKTDEPVLTGSAMLRTTISIPDGDSDLIHRLKLKGQFGIDEAQFASPQIPGKDRHTEPQRPGTSEGHGH